MIRLSNIETPASCTLTINGFNLDVKGSNLGSFNILAQTHTLNKPKITIDNSSFGSLDLEPGTEAVITDCQIDALWRPRKTLISAKNATVVIRDSDFERFKSKRGPTVLYGSHNTSVIISNSTLDKNRGLYGVIFLHQDCYINMTEVFVSDNVAYGKGFSALVLWDRVKADIQYSYFDYNIAFFGGAIWASNDSIIECSTTAFHGNKALQGGAIMIQNKSQLVVNKNSSFLTNEAKSKGLRSFVVPVSHRLSAPVLEKFLLQARHVFSLARGYAAGGAIAVDKDCSVRFESSSIIGNKAEISAGGLFVTQSNVTIKTSNFALNSATEKGGAILIQNGALKDSRAIELHMEYGTLWQNQAQYGGAIQSKGNVRINIVNSSYTGNTATEGGALNVKLGGRLKMNASMFFRNSASVGGALCIRKNTEVNIYLSTFSGNSANSGAAIFAFRNVTVRLDRSIFMKHRQETVVNINEDVYSIHTHPEKFGGTFYVSHGSVVQIIRSNFMENAAAHGAGAVFLCNQVSADISQSRFSQNGALRAAAIFANDNIQLSVRKSFFIQNTASINGGAIEGTQHVHIDIRSSSFFNNSAMYGGAVNINSQSTYSISNCTFSDQTSAIGGGALTLFDDVMGNITFSYFFTNKAGNVGGAISISQQSKCNIYHSTFHGHFGVHGGVLHAASHVELNISSSYFFNNKARLYGGSVFASDNVQVNVNGSAIWRSEAETGAAIYLSANSYLDVNNTRFINNSATQIGGAVMLSNRVTGRFLHCDFDSNLAKYGGALSVVTHSQLHMEYTTVRNNYAKKDCGSICGWESVYINITHCEFKENFAKKGGGMVLSNAKMNILFSNFTKNRAKRVGGGFMLHSGVSGVIGHCIFSNNTADLGGALYMQQGTELEVLYCRFDRNRASTIGGSIIGGSLQATFIFSDFRNNIAEEGGAIYLLDHSVVNFSDCTFVNNRAKAAASAMLLSRQVSVSLLRCNVTGNKGKTVIVCINNVQLFIKTSTFHGNFARKGNIIYGHKRVFFSMIDSNFTSNTAGEGHPAITIEDGKSNISGCNFIANTGGVLYLFNHTRSIITQCNFSRNTGIAGAAIAASNVGEVLLLDNSFDENKADMFGGALFCLNTTFLWMRTNNFTGNFAPEGGALTLMTGTTVDIASSNFTKNRAEGKGGSIKMADEVKGSISNCCFIENGAHEGGAVSSSLHVELNITNSIFRSNYAEDYGGAVSMERYSFSRIDSNTYSDNFAMFGGSIVFYNNVRFVIEQSKFSGSKSFGDGANSGDGGAIAFVKEIDGNISECYFTNNMATYGGVLCSKLSAQIKVSNTTFFGNRAEKSGGVVAGTDATKLQMVNCTFLNNTAKEGAVLVMNNNSTLDISNSSFAHNSAHYAGVMIAREQVTIKFTDSSFTKNTASSTGVLYIDRGAELLLTGCYFTENSETGDSISWIKIFMKPHLDKIYIFRDVTGGITDSGGVLTVKAQSNISIERCRFLHNKGIYTGVAFLHNNVTGKISDTVFIENSASHAGVFEAADKVCLDIENTQFTENTGTVADVAIILVDSHVNASNLTIREQIGNTVHIALIDVSMQSSLAVHNSIIHNVNSYSEYYYIFQCLQSSSITLKNVNLSHNQLHGIVLVRSGGSILIDNCTVMENIIRKSILSLDYYSTSHVIHSNFQRNKLFPNSQGSSFLDIGQNSTLVLNGSNLTNNRAVNASLTLVHSNSTLVAENCVFDHNSAILGGVVECKASGSVVMAGSLFFENQAAHSGGVLYSETCSIWIRDSNMTANKARHDGGCILSRNGPLMVCKSIF